MGCCVRLETARVSLRQTHAAGSCFSARDPTIERGARASRFTSDGLEIRGDQSASLIFDAPGVSNTARHKLL